MSCKDCIYWTSNNKHNIINDKRTKTGTCTPPKPWWDPFPTHLITGENEGMECNCFTNKNKVDSVLIDNESFGEPISGGSIRG